jgi:hypothetical protein
MHICPVNRDNPKQPKCLLNMKKITFILFALIAGTTFAQSAAADAVAKATIVSPITVTNTGATTLEFGNIASPDAATSIVVDNLGARTNVPGVTIPGGTVSAAVFQISAADGYVYNITLTPTDLTNGTLADDMLLTLTSNLGTSYTGNGAVQTLKVGGSLAVGITQTVGTYSGNANVTVDYQ